MLDFTNRIKSMDISLFDSIASQTSNDDRVSLLLLQRCVRSFGDYVYLEIGSHLGGTIQPYYVDPLCKLIYSVDKRPLIQPDERGLNYEYSENSTARMLRNFERSFPSVSNGRIITFDCDASQVNRVNIVEKPDICFIDGEHTNDAVCSDFKFCMEACQDNAIIAFHDAGYIFRGILKIKEDLNKENIRFKGFMLQGCVYAILMNGAVEAYADELKLFSQDESDYFSKARRDLFKKRLRNRIAPLKEWLRHESPLIFRSIRALKRIVTPSN
jgi:hypothetical protein